MLELPKVLSMLAHYCQIEATKRKVHAFLPLKEQCQVEEELGRVADILNAGLQASFSIPFEPGVLKNQIAGSRYLTESYFADLRNWFNYIAEQKKGQSHHPVQEYYAQLHEYQWFIREIDAIIDEHASVKDSASSELEKIRDCQRQTKRRVDGVLQQLLTQSAYLFSDHTIVERNGHYVLPVKVNFKKELKGIVHSYSNSGETVFIEPLEITDDAAYLDDLGLREQEEIERVLVHLTDQLRPIVDDIEQDINTIICLDMLFAKARFARDIGATRPVFGRTLKIIDGIHPLLHQVEKNTVPLNVCLDENVRVLVISGPNAGGKTIALKTIGTLVLMARCGLFIPVAEGSTMPFFVELYADIGDEQSIESQLSTFAGHIRQIKEALGARQDSLVLLDELMSQTSVEEGSALAQAVLVELAHRKGLVIATTHNENLKIFVDQQPNMVNAGMEYTDRPTYRLILGIPQPSNAIRLAQKLGVNHGVIERARGYLDDEKLSLNELFERLSRELKDTQQEKERLRRLSAEYEMKLNDFNTKKKQELNELKATYKREMIQSKRSIEQMIRELKKKGVQSERVREMRDFFEERLQEEKAPPYFPEVGEIVRIRALKKNGPVIEVHGGKYKVSLENIYYWVDPEEIEKIAESTAQ